LRRKTQGEREGGEERGAGSGEGIFRRVVD